MRLILRDFQQLSAIRGENAFPRGSRGRGKAAAKAHMFTGPDGNRPVQGGRKHEHDDQEWVIKKCGNIQEIKLFYWDVIHLPISTGSHL